MQTIYSQVKENEFDHGTIYLYTITTESLNVAYISSSSMHLYPQRGNNQILSLCIHLNSECSNDLELSSGGDSCTLESSEAS